MDRRGNTAKGVMYVDIQSGEFSHLPCHLSQLSLIRVKVAAIRTVQSAV